MKVGFESVLGHVRFLYPCTGSAYGAVVRYIARTRVKRALTEGHNEANQGENEAMDSEKQGSEEDQRQEDRPS
eukprot:scaffold64911_cov44-Attheya_sp.AAC.2